MVGKYYRKMQGLWLVLVTVLLPAMPGCTSLNHLPSRLPASAVRPVVAVSSFENRSGFPGEWQLGTGMADLLVSELVASENFTVVERQHLENVVGEIQRQRNELFRPEGRVERGKLKNAQYLIRGVINDFSQVSGGALSVAWRWLLFGGRGSTARVALTLTIVDVESGEILNSVQCAATAHAREAYASGTFKGVAFGGDAFFKTPLGIATRNAIRKGVCGIAETMPRRPWQPMIADVSDGRIILNGGSDRGFREGQTYVVHEPAHAVIDPATGDVLASLPGAVVGAVRIVKADPHIAFAGAVRGGGFRAGLHLVAEK